jgi:hypothetical protein
MSQLDHDKDNEKYLHSVEVRSASSQDKEKGYTGNVTMHDEVFGDINEDGPNYRGVSLLGGGGALAAGPTAKAPYSHSTSHPQS